MKKDKIEYVEYLVGIDFEDDRSEYKNFTIDRTQRRSLIFDFQPVVSSIPEMSINEDEPAILNLAQFISDRDNDMNDIVVSLAPEIAGNKNVSVSGTRLRFNYTLPKPDDMIYFEVSDGTRNVSSYVLVHVLAINDLPRFLDPGILNLTEDVPYILDLSKYIKDEESLFKYMRIDFTSQYAQLRGTDLVLCYPDGMTSDSILITVTDENRGVVERTIYIQIEPVNDPPELDLPDISPTEDIEFKVNLTGRIRDVEGPLDKIRISCTSGYCTVDGFLLRFLYPEGVKYDNFTITISDDQNSTAYDVNVVVHQVNDPPYLVTVPSIDAVAGKSHTINLWGYIDDPDTPKSKISLISTTKGVNIKGYNLTYRCPANTPSSKLNISLTIYDGKNSPAFNIPVNVTAIEARTQFIRQIEIWLYIFVPIAIVVTIAGILTYRRIRYGWYEIQKALIINQDGRMIANYGQMEGQTDEFLLSGMLTAIQQFIGEVMKSEEAGSTREFLHEKTRIVIERGHTIYLAVFLNGYTTEALKKKMKSIVENIERRHSMELARWDGNLSSAPFTGDMMAQLQALTSKK